VSKEYLAFLGTNDYLPCNYYFNDNKVEDVRFVQEAEVEMFCKDWTKNDRIIVFLTEEARDKNWYDDGDSKEGLKTKLTSLELKPDISSIRVPQGKSEEEIWKIFERIYDSIDDNSEVIVDVTHAYRYLPMLLIILLDYTRFLKDISIKGIYYGAFETLGTPYTIEKKPIEDRNVPIFDLTPFVNLFEWTSAVDDFMSYGDINDVNNLTKKEVNPLLNKTEGQDKDARNLRKLGDMLESFTKAIKTCRGLKIIDYDYDKLRKLIRKDKEYTNSKIKTLNPLLEKISSKISEFENGDIKNGYYAVKWCIKHGHIQQGFTLFQETMISEIVEKEYGKEEINDNKKRRIVSQAINIKQQSLPEKEWKKPARHYKSDVKNIMRGLEDDFIYIYDSISHLRNDINHAGFRESPSSADNLKQKLKEQIEKIIGGEKNV